jgi:hypothetical protein
VGYGLKQNGGDLFLAFPKIPRVPASPGCPQACLKYPRLFPGISPLGSLACFLSPKMSDFLAHLTSAPSRPHGSANITDKCYDHQLRDLIAYLKQPGVAPSTADLNGYLEAISPAVHSLSYLYLLRIRIQQLKEKTAVGVPNDLQPGGTLWKQTVKFLRSFDPIQIRYAGHEWRQLVESVASAAQSVSKVRGRSPNGALGPCQN